MAEAPALLEVRGLCKSYAVPVLEDFDFTLGHGEVHALLGANGAGKSTFARIVCGLTEATHGEMKLEGRVHHPRTRHEGEASGVVMVLQELNLIRNLSVAENLFLDRLPSRWGFVDRTALEREARLALKRVGLESISPAVAISRLGVGEQQLVEIAGALARNCKLLVLDEPTAALTGPEVEMFFENIRRLQRVGVGIVYISHRMDEIRRIATGVSVLRDGRRVAVYEAATVSRAELIRDMSGKDLPEQRKGAGPDKGAVLLRVENLCAGPRVKDISLTVHSGEIVGLAGLIGAGRTETLRAIYGADRASSGAVTVGGAGPQLFRKPSDATAAGIGLVPEDRKQDGLLLPQSIRANITLATLSRHSSHGMVKQESETRTSSRICERLDVRRSSLEQPVNQLSGGNQQKVVIGRWLDRDCAVLLCDEPTRGVDAAAKAAIQELLRDLARSGKGLLVVSSEMPELMNLCDRIVVVSAGRITGEFRSGEWTQEAIMEAAFQGHHAEVRE